MEKKSMKLQRILLLVGLVVLVAAFGLIMASCSKEEAQSPQEVQLYWNVEGAEYRSGKFNRMVSEDGYVYMIFSRNGEQMRLPVQDYLLACKIDMLPCAGLVFDENGVVVDALRVEECTGGYLVKDYIVDTVEGNTITCNSSGLLDGHEVTFEITDDTPVWNIGGSGITVGIPWTVGVDDKISVVKNEDGSIQCVYTEAYTPPMDIYWNVNRMYDSTSARTTRMSEPTGGYLITLACNGEVKDYKTMEPDVVQQIDAMAAKCFGLEFDEEGNIIGVIHAGTATGGGSCASWYHCMAIDGNTASFERLSSGSNMGATYSGPVSKFCQAFDVSGNGNYVGEPTELRVGDQVHCLRDNRNRICTIFVVSRKVESEIYWNVDRKYDSASAKTTRTPAADGWYYITVAVRGKQMVVKTQEWDIANSIDGRAAKCFGLKLGEDNVIEKFYTPNAAKGDTFASWYDVTELDGKNITMVKNTNGDIKKGVLADDCEIYNVSPTAVMVGEVSDVKVGDVVHTLKNFEGQINVCYVVTRCVDWPVYYNLDRKWNSATNSTTRTPDADGYYVFRMAVDGKEVTLKTKSLTVANDIDKEVAKCLTMSVDHNGIIYKAMHAKNTTIAKGAASSSYTTVTELSKNGFTTYKSDNGKYTKEKYAWNAKVYNVSSNVIDHQGEETTLQVGDYVHCLTNRRGEITFVYVMTRPLNLPVYYNLDRKWDDTAKVSTRTPDANGVYSFQLAYGGGEVTLQTTDPQVVYDIDKEVAMCVALRIDDNGYITYATHAKNSTYCGGGIGMSYATVTEVVGDQVTVNKDGKLTTFTISDDCEMFVTANIEGLTRGQYTTVRVGDYIHCLKNKDGETNYMAIMKRVKQMPVVDHTCQHVTEDVTWYAWDGGEFPVDGHYVLTEDLTMDTRVTINAGVEITLCLNGHTVTNADRFFNLYGTLNICDHKDGNGNYKGTLSSAYSGKVYGALAYMYNNKGNATLNIYGGNFVHTGEANNGAIVFLGQTSDRTYTAVMNMYDGVITGGNSTAKGGAIAVTNYSIFNMYGGEISGNKATSNGGAVYVAQGEFNMSDGLITGNTATGNGGGVDTDGGTFNMTGGIIENNKGAEGGNVRVGTTATVTISDKAIVRNGTATNGGNFTVIGKLNVLDGATVSGGTVTGQGTAISSFANAATAHAIVTVKNATINGSVRLDTGSGPVEMFVTDATVTGQLKVGVKACSLTVEGKVNLSEVRLLDGKVIAIGENGLDDASTIKVNMENVNAPFATITDPNDEKCFAPTNTSMYKIVNDNNDLYLESTVKPHTHCACDGAAKGKPNHTCEDTEYLPWTSSTSLPTSGKYYLTCDVNITSTYEIRSSLSLCLNGYTITGTTRIYKIYSTFNLSDCAEKNTDGSYKGKLLGNQTATTLGPVFYLYSGGTFNLFGGELTVRSDSKTAQAGIGGVQVGTMNMYGGTISGGNVTGTGGCISVFDGGLLRLYGGTVKNGLAATYGGNIAVSKGTLEIYEGATVTGGEVTKNTGGNIYVANSTGNLFKMTGGTVSYGKTAGGSDMSGGNIDLRAGDNSITGGTVTNGFAREGGNIRVGNSATLTIGGNAVIKDGSATNGGNIAVFSTLIVEGNAQIKDGTATAMGGNLSVYANAATASANITIKGGTFSGGTANSSNGGGNMRLETNLGAVNVTIIGGTITGGTASASPCVLVGDDAALTVTVGGDAKIDNMNLIGGKKINISTTNPLKTGASIGITMATPGVFAENVTTDVSGFFKSGKTGVTPVYDSAAKTLKLA